MFDLADAARRLDLTVKWVDLEGLLFVNANRSLTERRAVVDEALADIDEFAPDLVFSYGLEYLERVFDLFVPGMTARFQELVRRPAAYFFFDFGYPFDRNIDETTVEYIAALQGWKTIVFVWDESAKATLRAFGVTNSFPFPMAVNDRMFFKQGVRNGADSIPIVFVGGPTPERIQHLEPLTDLGLKVYGYDPDGWRSSVSLAPCYSGEVLERDRLRHIYSRARVSTNITRPHGPASFNMRVYEAMACGSLMLTERREGAEHLFAEGREIVTYAGPADLRAKVEHYLSHETERASIGDAGADRVRSEHTYIARLRAVLPLLNQFVVECRAADKLAWLAANDPAKALRFASCLDVEDVVRFNRANLRCAQAEISMRLGDVAAARRFADEASGLNPSHLAAARLKEELSAQTTNR
jgi:spore maturation protein CgeB